MASLMLFGGLFLLIILQVPVGVAIGASSLAAVLVNGRLSASYVAQALVTGTDSFPIMAVPLFVLAGELMAEGGVSRRLLNVFNEMFGRITGGLAIVTVVVCMFFAAVSGSGPATVAAVGSMVYPTLIEKGYTLIEKGYSKKFSLALIASAGAIGVIIPPSIPMVMYGVSTGTSITSLFMGGFLPGLLIGLALIFWCYFYCKRNGWKGEQSRFSLKRTLKMAWDAKWALINPIIILGGIYGGIFTPTEAASVAAIYALVVGIFVHRELNMKSLLRCLGNSCLTTATIMIILGCASAFTKVLTIEQIPAIVTHAMLTLTSSKFVMLLLITILLLIVGCVMDTTPAILVLAPILLPVVESFGVNPVHFGIVMVVNLAIGFITPPLGVNMFVAARVGNEKVDTVIKGIVPFIIVMTVCLLLITYIPTISMLLPNLID